MRTVVEFVELSHLHSSSGMTHKLERTPQQSEAMPEPDCDTGEEGTENESGYLSDSDCED